MATASSLYTYNVVVSKFQQFAEEHALIRRFTHGQIAQADLEKETEYPWMHVTPTGISFDKGQLSYTFDVFFADLPRDKDEKTEYQKQSISDCIQLAGDFVSMLELGDFFDESVVLTTPISGNPFVEEFSHVLTGVQLSIELSVDYIWDACDVPYGKQIVNVYSDPINFPSIFNSIRFMCNEQAVAYAYGDNCDAIENFVIMLNSNSFARTFGKYYIETGNTIRCEMPLIKYNELCTEGILTIQAFED